MKWIFGLISVNPSVKLFTTMTDAQRDDLNQKAIALSERLVEKDCRSQAVAAIKYTGPQAISASFGVLGQVAMRGLMNDPSVSLQMQSLVKYSNKADLAALYKEAGVSMPTPAKPAN